MCVTERELGTAVEATCFKVLVVLIGVMAVLNDVGIENNMVDDVGMTTVDAAVCTCADISWAKADGVVFWIDKPGSLLGVKGGS